MDTVKMETHQTYLKRIMMNREEFLVIGLTGRVGSGCSEVAKIFGRPFSELDLPSIFPGVGSLTQEEQDLRTLYQFARYHWLKFDVIKVRSVITSFLMEKPDEFFEYIHGIFGKEYGIEAKIKEYVKKELSKRKDTFQRGPIPEEEYNKLLSLYTSLENKLSVENEYGIPFLTKSDNIDKVKEIFEGLYDQAADPQNYHERKDRLEAYDAALESLSLRMARKWWCHITEESKLSEIWEYITRHLNACFPSDKMDFACYVFVHDIIPEISNAIHYYIKNFSSALFTELYQQFGNCLRRTGEILFKEDAIQEALEKSPSDIFAIPRRINHFIKVLRHPFCREYSRPTRVVIDSIKNIFEATYLRERYSAFYLYAISAEENVRINRLMDSGGKNMNMRDIKLIGWSEYADKGEEIYKKYSDKPNEMDEDEKAFVNRIQGRKETTGNGGHYSIVDHVRKNAYDSALYPFVLQNVGVSIENSDVFISTNHWGPQPNMGLRWEIIRNVCLTIYPGLLLPTPLERCMQVAFIAKANSGCLSRQVGAVVTDSEYNILSLGWNDVPCGDVSCARKNLIDLSLYQDEGNYTAYELDNVEFRHRVKSLLPDGKGSYRDNLCGLTLRYCFKDLHIDDRNPMRSRAMHAEEKALADATERCINGCLFTTSSPCEMCSKNAKNHKIKKIYYIEAYPGISDSQYTQSGDINNRAKHILFTGAIGRAYSQMYTPIMPHKDIQRLLGINLKVKKDREIIAPNEPQETLSREEKSDKT